MLPMFTEKKIFQTISNQNAQPEFNKPPTIRNDREHFKLWHIRIT